ncbi:3'-5' exonuclease [Defluviimonas salinarum]|uniref:Exonuclease domain-containing protein n=1 Tax=Defluviimonas salinarum TaxID=2992147 RepID=A0ABT3J5S5_9RHOB|nr:hypothetical protein [Defluviimonas salinarum]MCW3783012.1 hypothetical protein [Defluviimonas salinarum]
MDKLPLGQIAFIDFEASGLSAGSWPIEVGLSRFGDGTGITTWSSLVRPEPDWSLDDWSKAAEGVHGLSLGSLADAPRATSFSASVAAFRSPTRRNSTNAGSTGSSRPSAGRARCGSGISTRCPSASFPEARSIGSTSGSNGCGCRIAPARIPRAWQRPGWRRSMRRNSPQGNPGPHD